MLVEKNPAGQIKHELAALATEKVPLGQSTHSVAASPEYFPRAQSRQPELAAPDENVPALHAVHWGALSTLENWPGWHDKHDDACTLGYRPAPQAVQVVLPNDEMVPPEQGRHNAAASRSEYVPGVHRKQYHS